MTFEEFNAYFADGVLTTEELQELFYSIDGRQNNVLGQFVTRFMLRETSGQLLSLQRSLQCAMEAVEEQSCPAPREEVEAPAVTVVQKVGRRCGRRTHDNRTSSPGDHAPTLSTGVSEEGDENWCSQINRLQQLLDKLESQNLLLVQRQVTVAEEDLEDFRKVLKSYSDATAAQADNLHVSVQKLPEKSSYIMYEFWQDRISWMSYLHSNSSKDFQRCTIRMLVGPEVVATMLIPAACGRVVRRSPSPSPSFSIILLS
ncbi:hypothetical protein CRUP_003344, partial [Coryphaenoides rupestris]